MRKYDLMTFSYIYALHWKYKPGAHGSSSENLVSHHLWSSFNLQNLVASSYFLLWCSIQWVKMLSLWSTWRSLLLILLAKRKIIQGINWKSAKVSCQPVLTESWVIKHISNITEFQNLFKNLIASLPFEVVKSFRKSYEIIAIWRKLLSIKKQKLHKAANTFDAPSS